MKQYRIIDTRKEKRSDFNPENLEMRSQTSHADRKWTRTLNWSEWSDEVEYREVIEQDMIPAPVWIMDRAPTKEDAVGDRVLVIEFHGPRAARYDGIWDSMGKMKPWCRIILPKHEPKGAEDEAFEKICTQLEREYGAKLIIDAAKKMFDAGIDFAKNK